MSKNCSCLLAATGQEVKFEGNLEADIIFIFESPGPVEINERCPCRGPAGKRWETELNKIGITRQEVFIINAARCRINKQALSDSQIKQIIKSCRPALETAIKHIKPKVIVVCGGIASHSVMNVPITGVKKRRGTWDYSEEFNCLVLYTIHPSATLRNESDLPLFQQDLRSLQTFVNNGYSNPAEETNYQEVDSIKFMLDKSNITVGLDTETQGLKWFDENFVLISYSVSDAPRTGYNVVLWEEVLPVEGSDEIPEHDKYIVWHRDKEDVPVFLKKATNYDMKMNELRELLIREDIKKYTKNGIGYDCHVFEAAGLPKMVNHTMDVQLASHALDSELYLNNNLEFLTKSFTNMAAFKTDFKAAYKIDDMLWTLRENREAYNLYAIRDADATRRIGIAIREEMIKDPTTANYYMKLVHPIAETVLYNISKNGMLMDKGGIKRAEVEVLDELDTCEKECVKRIPKVIREKHKGFVDEKGNLNLNRRKLIADTLFTEDGFGLTATSFTAKTGDPQVSKDILKQLKLHAKKDAHDFLEWRENREELRILYSNYIKSLQEYIGKDNRIRTSMSVSFTSSGRVGCIRKGTKIEIARDIEKFPEGIPIEEVEVGSWAYSFDNSGKPCMNKVTGKFKTGIRELLRVFWKNQPNSTTGYVDVTPEHEFRLSNGSYTQAKHLIKNMSICSLRRSLTDRDSRPRIFLTNSEKKQHMEHRFIYESIHKYSPEVVHHIDGRKLNNSPCNLAGQTVTQHATYHNIHRDYRKPSLLEIITPLRALRLLAEAKGHPSKVPHDFTSYMKVLNHYGIDFREARKRYNTKGEFLGKDKIRKSLNMVMKDAIEYLGIRFEKWQYLIEFYGFDRPRKWGNQFGAFNSRINNHLIDRVEYLTVKDEVWDLEIENTHNFVAGGLSVHNSRHPNTMVFPARNKKQKRIVKSLFIAPPGYKLVNLDLSQAELRMFSFISGEFVMCKAYEEGKDLHTATAQGLIAKAGQIWDDLSTKEQKAARQKAKIQNFGLLYDMSVFGFRDYALNEYGIKLSKIEAKNMWESWHNLYPGVHSWHDRCRAEMYRNGKVRTVFGRNRYLRNLTSIEERLVKEAERTGINVLVQGPSSDYTLLGGRQMYQDGFIDTEDIKLVNFVHDSLLFEVKEERVMELAPQLKQRMEHVDTSDFGFELSVPMKVDIQIGDNLAEMEELEL